jgi:DNA mismatch endonuclease (patch repair protein)
MSRIKGKNTNPEIVVRRLIWAMGYRYRLHRRSLPGCPDLVFVSSRKVIFVHGCFWHGHNCRKGGIPKTRKGFWTKKITGNRQRDIRQRRALNRLSWRVLVIWECQLKKAWLPNRISRFLASSK